VRGDDAIRGAPRTRGVLNDVISIYFADATLASVFFAHGRR
jgi:hypothetical protein